MMDRQDGTWLVLGALGLAAAAGAVRRGSSNDDELLAATDVTSCPIPGSAAELSWREKYGEWEDSLAVQRTQQDRLAQAYHQGFLAVQQGKTVTQNPYGAGDLRHDEWAMGWQDTQTGSGNALTLHQWEKDGRLVHMLRTDAPNFRAKYAQAKRKYGLPSISGVVGAGYSHNIATVPLRLGYATYNVYQRWWWGQGDPLYVVLSRRGDSVDIVAVEATPAELERLIEVSHQILSDRHSDAGEKRTARATLTQISNLPPTNGAIGGGTVGLGSRATQRQRIAKALAGGALDQMGADELGSVQAALISAGSLNYVVQFVSVDGAGRYDEVFTGLADAKAFADTKQAESDANGNPWGYTYNVLHEKFERPPLYRTGSRALHEQGSGWTPKVFVSKQQAEDAIDNFRTQEARHYDASWAQFAGLPGPGWYIVDSDGRVIR